MSDNHGGLHGHSLSCGCVPSQNEADHEAQAPLADRLRAWLEANPSTTHGADDELDTLIEAVEQLDSAIERWRRNLDAANRQIKELQQWPKLPETVIK